MSLFFPEIAEEKAVETEKKRIGEAFSAKKISEAGLLAAKKAVAAQPTNIDRALSKLGFTTEIIQESTADQARENYANYVAAKREFLTNIRKQVTEAYVDLYTRLISVGFPQEEAENLAKESVTQYKQSLMSVYRIIYPHSGEKVKNIY